MRKMSRSANTPQPVPIIWNGYHSNEQKGRAVASVRERLIQSVGG